MLKRYFVSSLAMVLAAGCGAGVSGTGTSFQPSAVRLPAATATSVLKLLTKKTVIGSTVDPINGDDNPYGLTLAPLTVKGTNIKAGNAYICNFNATSGVEGTGTTVVSLAPTAGAKPTHFAQSKSLLGCTAAAMDYNGYTWTANFGAKNVAILNPKGKLFQTLKGGNFVRPFGIAYAPSSLNPSSLYPNSNMFVSDASKGTIILAQQCYVGSCTSPNSAIVSGLKVNNGKPGNILGPYLAFDFYGQNATLCKGQPCGRLWVVDGANNTVFYIDNIANVRDANSIVVGPTGKTFTGPLASYAHLVYSGSPLNGPIGATVVRSTTTGEGNVVVGNTLDPKGKNLLIEISPAGTILAYVNVDTGAMGALFGLATNGAGAKTKLYFNDDNENELEVLSQ